MVVGCGKGSSTRKKQARSSIDVSALEACKFAYDEGNQIDYTVAEQNLVTDPFGKKIAHHHLHRVYQASAKSTVDYVMQTLGADIFKVVPKNTSESDCQSNGKPFFHDITLASYPFMRFWDIQTGSGEDKKTILGLYLERANAYHPSLASKPTILLNSLTTRWTLIHEMAHHLYQVETGHHNRGAALFKKWKKSKSLFESIWPVDDIEILSNSDKDKIYSSFQAYFALTIQMLKVFSIEEMAIELKLREDFEQGLINFVDSEMKKNSTSYILSNFHKTLEKMKGLKTIISELKEALEPEGENENIGRLVQQENELEKLEEDVKNAVKILPRSNQWANALEQSPHKSMKNCSHAHIRQIFMLDVY